MNLLIFFFLVIYIGRTAFEAWLERLNIAHLVRRSIVPPGFEDFIDADKLSKINEYTRARSRLGMDEEIVSDAALLLMLLAGLLSALDLFLRRNGLHPIAAGLLFFLVPGAVLYLIELPFGYYHSFVLEEKFGFNRYTLKLWILDHIKSAALGLLIAGLLLAAVLWVISASPNWWWFWGFLIVSGVQVLLAVLYPVLIAPIFNKFEPVKDEVLAEKIEKLMKENGIRVKKILQMNAGTRSRHTNAYFTGFGRTKQIVLFDTLIESHSQDEILSVLAHEAGHYRKKHVLKQLILFEAFALAGFYLTWRLMQWPLLYRSFGFKEMQPYAGLLLVGIFWQKAGFFLQPLYAQLSRRFEKQADAFAVHMTGTAGPLIAAMKRLASDNLSNLAPHPLYAWFHYSHPPIVQRVENLKEAERSARAADSAFTKGPGG